MKTSNKLPLFYCGYENEQYTYPCSASAWLTLDKELFVGRRCVTQASPKLERRRKYSPCYESVEEYKGYNRKDDVEDGGQPEHVDVQVPVSFPYCCYE